MFLKSHQHFLILKKNFAEYDQMFINDYANSNNFLLNSENLIEIKNILEMLLNILNFIN